MGQTEGAGLPLPFEAVVLTCPDCGARMELKRSPQFGWFWGCERWPACKTTHGAHQGSGKPMGIPADAATRQARQEAHETFDTIWKMGFMKRGNAYRWLASRMGLTADECHIGRFSLDQCKVAKLISQEYLDSRLSKWERKERRKHGT